VGIMKKRAVLLFVMGVSVPAFADGKLTGRVTDLSDQPVKDASVVVSDPTGAIEATTSTDPTGHYEVTLRPGLHNVVFAFGNKKVTSKVNIPDNDSAKLDTTLEMGGEVIDVYDAPRPIQYAKPKQDPLLIPKYSDEAVVKDVWVKAWLLLDVDARGVVMRVKFLKRPAYGLDDIALRHAFNLKFSPARDTHGFPQKSYIVWPLEWPSMGWLQDHELQPTRLPNFGEVAQTAHGVAFQSWPPCFNGSWTMRSVDGGSGHAQRDCSTPDMSKANAAEPWIARDASMPIGGIDPVVDIDPREEMRVAVESAHRNKIAAYATSGLAIAGLTGTIIAWVQRSKWASRVDADTGPHDTVLPPGQLANDQDHQARWSGALFGLGAGTLVASIATGYFWSKSSVGFHLQANAESTILGMSGRF
jgi:hypothetical protein